MTPSILVIDDEPNLRCTISLLLGKAGYLVYTAATTSQVIELLDKRAYDLVFLDLTLPDISGKQLLAYIHVKYPDLPILVLSPYEKSYNEDVLGQIPPGSFLVKPVDPAAILFHVNRLLGATGETFSPSERKIEKRLFK